MGSEMEDYKKLQELNRRVLELKAEKKAYNADMNERIKMVEMEIKELVTGE